MSMIGILGASGLIGRHLYAFFAQHGREVLGTYYSEKREGLIAFDVTEGDFSIFNRCSHLILSAAITNIDACYEKKDYA